MMNKIMSAKTILFLHASMDTLPWNFQFNKINIIALSKIQGRASSIHVGQTMQSHIDNAKTSQFFVTLYFYY